MIDLAISHVVNQLNQYLKRRFSINEDVVIASNLMEQDGTISPNINNKLVIFLVNIEKENFYKTHQHNRNLSEAALVTAAPIHLNIFLMFAAHFPGKNYLEALKFISQTIAFFQKNPLFNHQITPDLDNRIDKLILDIENISIQDLSNLWGIFSGKYLPSVLYKMRMLTFESEDIKEQVSLIFEDKADINRKDNF